MRFNLMRWHIRSEGNHQTPVSLTGSIRPIYIAYALIVTDSLTTEPTIEEPVMTKIEQVIFSGRTHTTVNHDPNAQRGDHGVVDINLSAPGGENYEFKGAEPHPTAEQLFAGAWSACYITALGLAAQLNKVTLPANAAVDIQVD